MMRNILLLLYILPCGLSTSTIPANRLFQNTIRRWGITILNDKDRSERWNRFINAKDTVDRTTSGVILESLNFFTVLNNEEYELIVGPYRRQLNATSVNDNSFTSGEISRQKRDYVIVDIPDTYNYWEDEVGLATPLDQFGCGSCWSFPTVGTIEALYKKYTGEMVEFSQQYFIDCTFEGDGCGGGQINDGYKITAVRQYMVSYEKAPYLAYYQGSCPFADDIATYKDNAMTKIWVGDTIALSTHENALLKGLQTSPVAFGSYVSNDIFDYSGGTWTDSRCSSDPNAHAMLLVGYTETTLRVKASYGSAWGDGGYINYDRGTATLEACNFYKDAFALRVAHRRELEYAYCNSSTPVTYKDCKNSCEEMNTGSEAGWGLAVIPTLYHNQKLVDMVEEDYPGVKSDDKFNLLWIGIKDPAKNSTYEWVDGSEVSYKNSTLTVAKYGMLNKNTGQWLFKNSLNYEARGLCSRAINCRDISTAVQYGEVTFDNAALTEGTIATVTCSEGGTLEGDSQLTCLGGVWSSDLPSCAIEAGACPYSYEAGTSAKLDPDQTVYSDGDDFTVTCNTDGSTYQYSCTDGAFEPAVELCPTPSGTCELEETGAATLDPDKTVFELGEELTVTCNEGNKTGTFTCIELAFDPVLVSVGDFCSGADSSLSPVVIIVIVVLAGAILGLFS